MIKAVLFDMDGLLVDSETLGIEVVIEVCKELGFDITPDEQQGFIGVTDEKFYRDLFEKRNLSFDIPSVLKRQFSTYEELLRTRLHFFDGATTVPQKIKDKNFKLALVSGSTRNQIEIILNKLNILNCFDVIISSEDIQKSKPDPEGYLLAATSLGVKPEECVVLEDARTGVLAGKSAGMKVIAVINKGVQDLSAADEIVQDLLAAEQKILYEN